MGIKELSGYPWSQRMEAFKNQWSMLIGDAEKNVRGGDNLATSLNSQLA